MRLKLYLLYAALRKYYVIVPTLHNNTSHLPLSLSLSDSVVPAIKLTLESP